MLFAVSSFFFFFFNDTATTEIYTLSLHDALPICYYGILTQGFPQLVRVNPDVLGLETSGDRKSTRLNSSHPSISYAVFCLKKKKKIHTHEAFQIQDFAISQECKAYLTQFLSTAQF